MLRRACSLVQPDNALHTTTAVHFNLPHDCALTDQEPFGAGGSFEGIQRRGKTCQHRLVPRPSRGDGALHFRLGGGGFDDVGEFAIRQAAQALARTDEPQSALD